MSKRRKYKISRDEAAVAILLRLNADRWFTDWDVTELLGGTPHNHLNRLSQLRVVDVLRIDPEPTFRWSAKAESNNPQYIARLTEVVGQYGIKTVNAAALLSDEGAEVRDVADVLEERAEPVPEPEPKVHLTSSGRRQIPAKNPDPPRDPRGPMNEGLGPDDDGEEEEPEEYTAEQLKLMHEYERKMGLVKRRGSTGRFVKNNLVWHPEYGSGVVEHQQGGKQMAVKFSRPHGKLIVMDVDLTEDTAAIARAEELTCLECGNKFIRTTPTGRPSLYCSRKCSNRRNARVRAEKTVKSAERTAATASKTVEALKPATPPEVDMIKLTTSAPNIEVAILLKKTGEKTTAYDQLTVEQAIEQLMELLP